MVQARIHSEEHMIDHMGQPGEGVPIALIYGGKGPYDGFWGQSSSNIRVFKDISPIIVIHKIMVDDPAVYGQGDKRKKETDPKIMPNGINRWG